MGRVRVIMSIWAALPTRATNRMEHLPRDARSDGETAEEDMADDREKLSNGPNDRAINETIAGTGPGIADDALSPGETLPEAPSDEEVDEIARKLGAPTAERNTLPLDGE